MTHREFFDTLRGLGPLRVISLAGPSVFAKGEELAAEREAAFADVHGRLASGIEVAS